MSSASPMTIILISPLEHQTYIHTFLFTGEVLGQVAHYIENLSNRHIVLGVQQRRSSDVDSVLDVHGGLALSEEGGGDIGVGVVGVTSGSLSSVKQASERNWGGGKRRGRE